MATLKDVARLAGVSVSTVSRVVNESSLVDHATREKVNHAIKMLNIKPNLVCIWPAGKEQPAAWPDSSGAGS